MYITSKWKNGVPDFIKVTMLLCRIDMFFFFIYKIGDWSLNSRFISRYFFDNYVDRLSRKQRFKVKTSSNNMTLVLENMLDGHISIIGNRKKCVTSIISRIFLEILSYWKKTLSDISTNTIPISKRK